MHAFTKKQLQEIAYNKYLKVSLRLRKQEIIDKINLRNQEKILTLPTDLFNHINSYLTVYDKINLKNTSKTTINRIENIKDYENEKNFKEKYSKLKTNDFKSKLMNNIIITKQDLYSYERYLCTKKLNKNQCVSVLGILLSIYNSGLVEIKNDLIKLKYIILIFKVFHTKKDYFINETTLVNICIGKLNTFTETFNKPNFFKGKDNIQEDLDELKRIKILFNKDIQIN